MAAMTMTEKILARHAKKASVAPGENIWVDVDILMTHDVCGPGTIGVFYEQFGKNARVPVTWLVAANDTYFWPAFSRQLADAFRTGGGRVEFHALPAFGGEGHWLAESESGVRLAASDLDRALKARPQAAAKKR